MTPRPSSASVSLRPVMSILCSRQPRLVGQLLESHVLSCMPGSGLRAMRFRWYSYNALDNALRWCLQLGRIQSMSRKNFLVYVSRRRILSGLGTLLGRPDEFLTRYCWLLSLVIDKYIRRVFICLCLGHSSSVSCNV